jgi:hypothetical protein
MNITKPGIYRNFPTAAYFADPTPEPSLSQSLAKILLEQSPLHAFHAHPRLHVGVADEDEDEGAEKYDSVKAIGNAAHALMLDRGKEVVIGEFKDWRKKEARDFRAMNLANGKEPILSKNFETAGEMVNEALAQLSVIPECENAFTNGDAEVVIANCEDGIWLRSMIDWITPDLREVWDYKTSGKSAAPHVAGKQMADAGWHIQAAMHERILDAVDPRGRGRRRHLFVCQENEPPYALTVNEITEAALTIGRKKIDYAIRIWRHCRTKHQWPSYPPRINQVVLPTWSETAWLNRELEEEANPSLIMAG